MSAACAAARDAWERAFEADAVPPAWAARHLDDCPACRRDADATLAARRAVRSLPLPPPDREADRALLAELRATPTLTFWTWVLGAQGWRRGWRAPAAGALSFLTTLALAAFLTADPPTGVPARAVVPPAEPEAVAARLEAWAAMPAPTLLPPRAPVGAPRRREPAGAPPRRGHARSVLSTSC